MFRWCARPCSTTTPSPRRLRDHDVEGVVHLGGYKYAGVSVSRPLHTYEQNVSAMANLLQAMQACEVDKFVFSSSAAIYGTTDVDLVTETTPVTRSRRTARPS